MTSAVHSQQHENIGYITLDRPEALNALSGPMIQALLQQLHVWQNDNTIDLVILEGKGRAFCAGGDVRQVYANGRSGAQETISFFQKEYQLNHLIGTYPKPFVALMNGITMGGGVGISLHGAYPIATEHFIFAMPETAIGLFPDVGASHLLSRLSPGVRNYLALTGKRLTAKEALGLGLVKSVVLAEKLPLLKRAFCELAVSDALDACSMGLVLEKFSTTDTQILAPLDMIERCFHQDTMEAIVVALKAETHPWAAETLMLLMTYSPLSLKVTLLQMQRVEGMSLAGCLALDECLIKHFMTGHDFYEGVRALLIDKDKTPRWSPATLADVTNEQVQAYFKEL